MVEPLFRMGAAIVYYFLDRDAMFKAIADLPRAREYIVLTRKRGGDDRMLVIWPL